MMSYMKSGLMMLYSLQQMEVLIKVKAILKVKRMDQEAKLKVRIQNLRVHIVKIQINNRK